MIPIPVIDITLTTIENHVDIMDYLKNTRIHQKFLGISYRSIFEGCNTFSCNHGLVIMRKYLVGGISIVLFIVIKLAFI